MAKLMRLMKLTSGKTIPVMGLGVYQSAPGEECFDAVKSSLKLGYRHIDTAQFYENEHDVGRAVKASGVPREEIFITSKLDILNFGYENAVKTVKESLRKLEINKIDLFLLHAPHVPELRVETWKALEDLHKEGFLTSIGVSNFSEQHLEKLAKTAIIPPAVNQIEVHPWLQRVELVKYCQDRNIVIQAYSPLAKAKKLSDPVVLSIAKRLKVSVASVLIAWSLQKGFVTLPKSNKIERQRENLLAVDLTLSAADIALLDSLEEYFVTGWDPIKEDAV